MCLVARHSESLTEMVVYQALYESEEFGQDALWVRPLEVFTEHVEKPEHNYSGPRFKYIGKE